MVNSILWGNYAPAGPEISPDGSITIRYSDVAGLGSGTGNIDRNPLFLNPRPYSEAPTTAGDYHIRAGSPCIDMGTGDTVTYPTIPAYDLDWDPRPQRGGYDMGSDERSLLRNGSFEKGSGQIPVPWGGKNLLFLSDGRDVSTAHSGRASFRISGNTAAKEVGQLLSLSGSAGDRLSVYCWHKAKEPSASGGLFGAVITVYHTDGSSNAYILGFPKRSHNWQKSQGTFTALKDYAKVKVSLVYANQKGFAWFDDVQLSVLK